MEVVHTHSKMAAPVEVNSLVTCKVFNRLLLNHIRNNLFLLSDRDGVSGSCVNQYPVRDIVLSVCILLLCFDRMIEACS